MTVQLNVPNASLPKEEAPLLADTRIPGNDAALHAALHSADLPTADLDEPGQTFFAYRATGGAVVGFGGYECLGEYALVRSVVVIPGARGKGIGRDLLALLLRRAFDDGVRQAWLFTTTAPTFFEKAGFHRVERSKAPAAILATREAANLCPVSAVLLTKDLRR